MITEKALQQLIKMKLVEKKPIVCPKIKRAMDRVVLAESIGVDVGEIKKILLNLAIQFKCIEGEESE
jgi:hypothetical protein